MTLQQKHQECVNAVYANDYYLKIFAKVLESRGYTQESVMNIDGWDIPLFWNDFWFELPDSPAIHRSPFYDICDLCEEEIDDEYADE